MSKIKSFLLLTILLSSPLFLFADESQLTVRGFARLHKPADKLSVTISVITESESAEEALRDNSGKMQTVIDALKNLGIDDSGIQTGSFDIRPVMTPRPDRPPADWVSTIQGYRVDNSVLVETDRLSLAGPIIDTASKAGANAISMLNFTLQNPRAYRAEAIELAADHAISDANSLANAVDVRLGEILDISLDETAYSPARMTQTMSFADTKTPIEIGNVEVTAGVKIIFEIESH